VDYSGQVKGVEAYRTGQVVQHAKTITEADVVLFAGLSGDFNPVHVDREYAAGTRFGKRVVHGILTTGLISAAITKLASGAIYLAQEVRFINPVFIDDTITAEVEVTEVRPEKGILVLSTRCFNQKGDQVIDGKAMIMVPRKMRRREGDS